MRPDIPEGHETPIRATPPTSAAPWLAPTTTIEVSDYARQHPDHYGLRPIVWRGGKVVHVELTLMDLEWDAIDEAGCNCDLDSPCNNPRCVMERRDY